MPDPGPQPALGILHIEDNPESRVLVRSVLEPRGFDVLEASDGMAGIDLAIASHPDLILCDIQLPGLDGYETRSADSASCRAKLAPAAEIAGETSAKRADALQVGRGLSSGREGTVANDDHFRVPADTGLVADRPRDVLHQRLEILAFDAGLEVRKPVRRIGGRIRHAVMVQGVAVTPDSEFAHASLLTGGNQP
jgi:two-component system cell cycle response regulator DivK